MKTDKTYIKYKHHSFRKDYYITSRLNEIFIFLFLGASITFFTLYGLNLDNIYYLSFGISSFVYAFALFQYSRFIFMQQAKSSNKNPFITSVLKKYGLSYDKSMIMKYLSVVIYQSSMITLFFYSLLMPLDTVAYSGIDLIVPILSSIVFFSLLTTIFFEYRNSYDSKEVEKDLNNKTIKIFVRIKAYLLFILFWNFCTDIELYRKKT